jgi:hypothetical protein
MCFFTHSAMHPLAFSQRLVGQLVKRTLTARPRPTAPQPRNRNSAGPAGHHRPANHAVGAAAGLPPPAVVGRLHPLSPPWLLSASAYAALPMLAGSAPCWDIAAGKAAAEPAVSAAAVQEERSGGSDSGGDGASGGLGAVSCSDADLVNACKLQVCRPVAERPGRPAGFKYGGGGAAEWESGGGAARGGGMERGHGWEVEGRRVLRVGELRMDRSC